MYPHSQCQYSSLRRTAYANARWIHEHPRQLQVDRSPTLSPRVNVTDDHKRSNGKSAWILQYLLFLTQPFYRYLSPNLVTISYLVIFVGNYLNHMTCNLKRKKVVKYNVNKNSIILKSYTFCFRERGFRLQYSLQPCGLNHN